MLPTRACRDIPYAVRGILAQAHDIVPRIPELLAPAGGPDALRAAVNNGADAVYCGVGELNARRGAENFTYEGFAEATRYAHLRGVRVYLTANVVVLPDEMPTALATVATAWEAGADAVIAQDLGLIRRMRRDLPDVRVHASTQIDAHNSASLAVLAELGVSRVTLARELALAEIGALATTSPVELESFVHGALCFSHSGQCLLASMVGGRSANRGLCSQPCRLAYSLVDGQGRVAETPGAHLLSPRDLAGITLLPDLVRSGVSALKIEGRMKSPEYVALVTGVYRAALDRAATDPEAFSVTDAEWDTLTEAFSRGFSEAYLADIRDDRMMGYGRPNDRGLQVGRVTSCAGGGISVELSRPVEEGDSLEVWTSSGHASFDARGMRVGGHAVTVAPAGCVVTMEGARGARAADRVFRVANAALLAAARRTYADATQKGRVALDVTVSLRIGEPAAVQVAGASGSGRAEGGPVEPARTRAVTAAEVIEHVGRLGGTPYEVASWHVDLAEGVGIGFSELHRLRREAIDAMEGSVLRAWSGRRASAVPLGSRPPSALRAARVELVVSVADPEAAAACLAAGADKSLVAVTSADPPSVPSDHAEPLLPRIVHDAESEAVLAHARASGRATAGNLGVLAAAAGEGVAVAADWGLNVTNADSAAVLADLGADLVWASPELSGEQTAALAAGSPVPLGALVAGRVELMVAEHCVLQAVGACSHACASCERRRGTWVLRDRKDYGFPVTTDAAGRAHVYNSVPLDLSRSLAEVLDTGVAAIRLELRTESPDEAARLTSAWRAALDATLAGVEPPAEPAASSPTTTGRFHRGVR